MSQPDTGTPNSRSRDPHKSGTLRRYVPRLLLAGFVGLGMLKLADIVVGRALNSRERHLLRLAPEAHLRHRSNEFDYEFRTNHLGLRGPDIPFPKPRGTFRIVVLGDSFVAGYGVAEEHLLTTLLEQELRAEVAGDRRAESADADSADKGKKLPRVKVVNVGRVGTSTIRELDLYETIGRRFQPDLVVLAYYLGNDLAEVVQEQTHAELTEWHPDGWIRRWAFAWYPSLYLELAMIRQSQRQLREFTERSEREIVEDVRQEARARGRGADSAVRHYESLSPKLRQDAASGMLSEQRIVDACIEPDRLERSLGSNSAEFASAWERTTEHLSRLHRAVQRDGAQLVLVAIPAPFQVDRKSLRFQQALGYRVQEAWLQGRPRVTAALEDWTSRENVPLLDLTDQFRGAVKPLYFIEDVHFTPEGSAAAAEAIGSFLRSRELCP